jgi:PemK-like, MazF-like toxin of type II toxin-antitoxin system
VGDEPATGSGEGSPKGLAGRFRDWRAGRRRRRVAYTTQHAQAGLPDALLDEVTIAYEPCLDGDPDPGEVVWAWVPYEEDHTQGKDRPVIVIGRHGAFLAGIQLTTKGADHPENVFVGSGGWDPQRRDSWAKLDRIVQIDPSTVRRADNIREKQRFDQLASALQRYHRRRPAGR